MSKLERLQIRVDKEVLDAIEKKCKEQGITKTEYVTKTIENYLNKALNVENLNKDDIPEERDDKIHQIHIRLNEQVYRNIKKASACLGISLNSFVSIALKDYTSSMSEKIADIEKRIDKIEDKLFRKYYS